MNTSGFLTSLVTSFLIFLFLFLLHAWLSRIPANSVLFYPSKILHQLPLLPSPTTFSWISEAWSSTEQQIIRYAGIDAAVYLIFLRSALSICVYSALFCLPVLLPISRTDDYYEAEKRINSSLVFTNFDKMAMGNIRGGSKRLWAFFIGAYWVTIVTLVVLWRAYRHVVALRTSDQASAIAKPEQFTVLVRDIPPPVRGRTLAQEVDAFFKRLHPGTYERCMIVTNISRVLKVWKELESCKKNLVNAEAEFAELSIRPTHRTGLLGLIGRKVDSIEYYSERVEQLIPKLKEEQRLTLTYSQQGAALVFFNSRGAATSAAQVMSTYNYNMTQA